MPWDLDNDRPIYLQLMERIQQDIIAGIYNPGDKLPSVRDLALDASVNPNTMPVSYTHLDVYKRQVQRSGAPHRAVCQREVPVLFSSACR